MHPDAIGTKLDQAIPRVNYESMKEMTIGVFVRFCKGKGVPITAMVGSQKSCVPKSFYFWVLSVPLEFDASFSWLR